MIDKCVVNTVLVFVSALTLVMIDGALASDLIGTPAQARFVNRPGVDRDRGDIRIKRAAAIADPLPDPTVESSFVRFASDSGPRRVFGLDTNLWTRRGRGFRYKDLGSSAAIRKIALKTGRNGGRLTIKAGGSAFGASAISTPLNFVEAELAIGSERYCGRFAPPDATATVDDAERVVFRGSTVACESLVGPIGPNTCTLAPESEIRWSLAITTLALKPTGTVIIDCGTENFGLAPCTCKPDGFDAMGLLGIGDVCVAPGTSCSDGELDCGGSAPTDIDLVGNHDIIGACVDNTDCAAQCDANCAGLGASYQRHFSSCEGFCVGGALDGVACVADSACIGGICAGRDPGQGGIHPGVCNCSCAARNLGVPSGSAALVCNFDAVVTIETDTDGICGNSAPAVTFAPACNPLTTTSTSGVLFGVNNVPAQTMGPSNDAGAGVSCEQMAAGSVAGLTLTGHGVEYDTVFGDLLTENRFVCAGP